MWPGPSVWLQVADTGTGIDEVAPGRVFEPFFSTKERGRGTGLGPSTVYGVVNQTGGDVTIASQPGVGTTVSVYLPVAIDGMLATAEPSPVQRRLEGGGARSAQPARPQRVIRSARPVGAREAS